MEMMVAKKWSFFYSLSSGDAFFEEFKGEHLLLVFSNLEDLFQSIVLSFEDLKTYTLRIILKITDDKVEANLSEQVFDFGNDSLVYFTVVFLC